MENKNLVKSSHVGEFDVNIAKRTRVTLRTTHPFTVVTSTDGFETLEILAPNSDGDRYYQDTFERNTVLRVLTDGASTLIESYLPEPMEYPDPESLCEVLDEEQLSLYDRLKAEVMSALSQYAEEKGLDTFEDDSDLSFEEEDGLILTPYEYESMKEDFLSTLQPDVEPTLDSSIEVSATSEQAPTDSPQTESTTTTEQPAS